MKTLLLVVLIALATAGGILAVRKGTPTYPDYSPLARQLADPDWRQRQSAVTELSAKGKRAAILTILSAAREENPAVRVTIERALTQVRDRETLDWLASEGLRYPDRWTRYYAVRALVTKKGPSCLPELLALLPGNFWQVQIAILDIVEETGGNAGAVEALAGLVGPAYHWQVRQQAIRMLGTVNSANAARHIISNALPAADKDPDPEMERIVEDALAGMKDAEALGLIADQMTGNPDPARRLVAIKAVGRARFAAAFPKLSQIFADKATPTPARIAALRAAIQAGGNEGVQLALAQLGGEDQTARLEAAYALSEVELDDAARQAVQALIAREQDWRVKQALQIALRTR